MMNRSRNSKLTRMPVILLFVLSVSLWTAGCGRQEQQSAAEAGNAAEETGADGRIGIVFDSFVIERWERDRDIFTATARELGADVIVGNANGDAAEQRAIIDHFIESGVDVIVVVAVDGRRLGASVEKAHKAGIRVISYDRIVNDAGTDLYITFDNGAVGRYMAEVINDALPEGGTLVKVNGPSTDYNVTLVNEGFDAAIHENIRLMDGTECGGWNDEEAYRYMTAHPEDITGADAVMCGNDAIAGQVVRALAERRRAGQMVVTGQDADLEACQRVVEGTQSMTVYKPIEELAGTLTPKRLAYQPLMRSRSSGSTSTTGRSGGEVSRALMGSVRRAIPTFSSRAARSRVIYEESVGE